MVATRTPPITTPVPPQFPPPRPQISEKAVKDAGLNDLRDGQRIEFETEPDRRGKGPKAVNLKAMD